MLHFWLKFHRTAKRMTYASNSWTSLLLLLTKLGKERLKTENQAIQAGFAPESFLRCSRPLNDTSTPGEEDCKVLCIVPETFLARLGEVERSFSRSLIYTL